MKQRTIASLLIALVLTACGSHSSSFSSNETISSSDSSFSISRSSEVSSTSESNSFSSSSQSSSSSSQSTSISSSSESSSSSSSPIVPKIAYDGYYQDITTWSDGEDLKQQLYDVSRKTYHPLNYTNPNYQTNINADHTYYDFEYLDVIYSENDCYKGETNKGWQREHAFCASLMCGSLTADAVKRVGRATDFHNLLAANASANSSRGNKNYGVADKTHANYQNRTTNQGLDGYSFDPVNFEPGDNDKGRVARAIFYMAMMYKNDEVDEVNGITMKGLRVVENPVTYVQGENGAFAIGNLSTLLDWNKRYPVDYLEMQHNISVYRDINTIDGFAQGNRNPFVDYPELVDYVFGEHKDESGDISMCTPRETTLHCESDNNELSHYALKEAKRAYVPGTSMANDDYQVVKVLNNYNIEEITTGYTNSLTGHTFSTDDGEAISANITVGEETIKYKITLNPLGSCSSGEISLNTTGVNKGQKGENQEITYGGVDFLFNFDSSVSISSSNTMTITNINQDGVPVGITLGSKTKPLTKFTLTTKNSYRIDAAYIKAFIGNNESSYTLQIKVGSQVLLDTVSVTNKDVAKIYGASRSTPLEGQVSYIFEGTSSLKINSVAFNAII